MPELPPTTPSELELAVGELTLPICRIADASTSITKAKHALDCYAQGTAVERLIEAADRAEEAMNAARNAARLLF